MNKEEWLKLDCKHEDAYTRSCYVGDKFTGSATYCRDCEEGFTTKPEETIESVEGEKHERT